MPMMVESGIVNDPGPAIGYLSDGDSAMETVLELWVDTASRPTTIRLSGVLDRINSRSVGPIVVELLGEGYRDFLMRIDGLELSDDAGVNALMDIEQLIKAGGGSFARIDVRQT
jgi:hypothetical protein